MENQFTNLLKERRSIYALGKNVSLSNDQILALVKTAVKESPSSFNSQTSRAVVLFGGAHEKLWDLTEAALKIAVPEGQDFAPTIEKLNSFRAGYGTILFFEDMSIVKNLQEQFALYADRFPVWAQQTSAMHQYAMWTELRTLNVGANLQHYNPLVDEDAAKAFAIPDSWELVAQMPFGNIVEPAGEKTYQPVSERMKVLGL